MLTNRLTQELIVVWLLPAAVALAVIVATGNERRKIRRPVIRMIRLVCFGYLAVIAVLTLWPFDFNYSFARWIEGGNWKPFEGTIGFLINDRGTRDAIANLILFAPIGILLPFAFDTWRGIALTIWTLAFFAFGLESVQGLFLAGRTFDIDDAIAGFVGGLAGVAMAALLRPLVIRGRLG